jgi:hypothetical protein
LGNNCYSKYRRRNNGFSFFKDNFNYINEWSVPYNPTLTRKYNAHINVECVSNFATIKYLPKYITKGSDRATLLEENSNDEIGVI